MSVNIREAEQAIGWCVEAGFTALLVSPPGFGKTDRLNSIVMRWKNSPKNTGKRLGLACAFMATQSPISATGLPWKGERVWKDPFTEKEYTYTVTDPAIPMWFMARDLDTSEIRPASMFDHVFLVIEEWGQGNADTKRAFAEVLRAGGTPPFYMPVGSPRVALSNSDARDGVTKEFDFIINRVLTLPVHGDVPIWIEDFADKPYKWEGEEWSVSSYAKSYIQQNGKEGELFEPKPEVQGPWCSPRSYTNADRIVQVATRQNGGKVPVDSSLLVNVLSGIMGTNVTTNYMAALQFMVKLPSIDKVAADPMGTDVPKQADLQMTMAYELAYRVRPDILPPVLQYMNRLNDGMDNIFIASLMRKDWKQFSAEPVMKAWVAQNAARLSVLSSIATGM